jgi:hypothetical protein
MGMKKYKNFIIRDADKAKRQKSHTDVFPSFCGKIHGIIFYRIFVIPFLKTFSLQTSIKMNLGTKIPGTHLDSRQRQGHKIV